MRRLFFLHIHKNGGTSTTNSIESSFKKNEVCPINFDYQFKQEIFKYSMDNFKFFRGHISLNTRNLYFPDTLIFSIVREPISRLKSLYIYLRKQGLSNLIADERKSIVSLKLSRLTFEQFVCSQDQDLRDIKDNVQAKILAGANYGIFEKNRVQVNLNDNVDVLKSSLNLIDRDDSVIGTTNKIDSSLKNLEKKMKKKFGRLQRLNTTSKNESNNLKLSPKAHEYLMEITRIDKQIFDILNRN